MTLIPTREHHLVAPGSVAAREDYTSAITGPRTRWWIFDPAFTNSPSWTQNVGNLGREVWLLMWVNILPGYSSYCGRLQDGHSEVSDTDILDHASIPGGGVSAFAIDHNAGTDDKGGGAYSGLVYVAEPEGDDHANPYHFTIIPDSSLVKGTRYRLKIHLTLGRRGTANPGACRIWALDFNAVTPVVDLSGISTVWANQSVMHFFQGPYQFGATCGVQMAATRFGLTETDAYADGVSRTISYQGQVAGYGPNDFTTDVQPWWDTTDFGSSAGGGGGTGGAGTGTVAIVNNGTAVYYNDVSNTQSVTLTAGVNSLVVRHVNRDGADVVTGMTYNGVALSKIGGTDAQGVGHVTMWQIASPATGAAHNLVVTLDGSNHRSHYDYLGLSGVDTTGTPFGTPVTQNTHGTTPTATVTSATGDLVVDCGMIYQDAAPTVTVTGGQTADTNTANSSAAADPYIFTSHKAGSASVTPAWNITVAHDYGYMAVNVHAAPAAPASTPVNTAAPTITGTPTVGQVLTGHDGTWTNTPTSYNRQWRRTYTGATAQDITSATGTTYTLVDADDGAVITYRVTANNASGASNPADSVATATVTEPTPTNSVVPAITGTFVVGGTHTASTGTWAHMAGRSAVYQYQWYVGTTAITGATAATYLPVTSDAGKNLSVKVTATNSGGTATATSIQSLLAVSSAAGLPAHGDTNWDGSLNPWLQVALNTDGSLRNLGINAISAASTPGNVVRKVQVFDQAGNSLGYIAIYDQIG